MMREPGRTGCNLLPRRRPPTLEEVMEYISTDYSPPWTREPSILSTVTVAPYPSPTDPSTPVWLPIPNAPEPKLIITEQPKQRGMRFRYQCEGRSAGSILGEGSNDHSKTLPAIRLWNCDTIQDVTVSICLVWKDPPHRIHPHSLVGKDCHDGICEVTLHPVNGITEHSFSNLGIQCIRKKEIESSVKQRLSLGIDPYSAGMWRHHEEVDLNVVRLCFQAWYTTPAGERISLNPVLSEPVYDKKSTNTSELKIYRMNKHHGRPEGGEEIYILCDKVQKEDIQVVFFKDKWESRADFSQADVHRQIAIVMKTPPYYDLHLKDPVHVQVCLQRITDGVRSDAVSFTYMPLDLDSYPQRAKRLRLYSSSSNLNSWDPHGIESKRRQDKPDLSEYLKLINDNEELEEMFTMDDLYNFTEPSIYQLSKDEDDNLASWRPPNFDDTDEAISFDNLLPSAGSEATASLVGLGLSIALTGERQFPDCAYPGNSRMGGC